MQKESLTYEWNDVALLADQRAYTIVCKTMLRVPQQIGEIQEVVLSDWTWQRETLCSDVLEQTMVPFQGTATLQIYYMNMELQQETFCVDVPIQGAWQEPLTEQNSMRLVYYHTKIVEERMLLETVLQISRNQPLAPTQVLLGQFQMEELLTLDVPWPSCDTLLATSVNLAIQDWEIAAQQLKLHGEYQMVCIYQSNEPGEQVFVYESRSPMTASVLVPEGLQELSGVMPYYQSLTAQLLDTGHIQIAGSGVFCTLPVLIEPNCEQLQSESMHQACDHTATQQKEQSPSVINSRGSRRATLSKYMRNLNNSVETPSSIRNIEISTEHDLPD